MSSPHLFRMSNGDASIGEAVPHNVDISTEEDSASHKTIDLAAVARTKRRADPDLIILKTPQADSA